MYSFTHSGPRREGVISTAADAVYEGLTALLEAACDIDKSWRLRKLSSYQHARLNSCSSSIETEVHGCGTVLLSHSGPCVLLE